MTLQGSDTPVERFSLVSGGPFHAVLGRLGLLGTDRLPTRRAAISLALVAWVPPALLATVQSFADDSYRGLAFFADFTSHTRYLLAIAVMITTERYASGRILLLIRQFREAQLLTEDSSPSYAAALELADRRSGSALAETFIATTAFIWSGLTTSYAIRVAGRSWDGALFEEEVVLSWAGEAARFVSTPLFVFLTLRWFWRLMVWTGLLYRLSKLPLDYMPLHPDRSAGVGFLAIYPSVFTGFIFAESAVVAASLVKELGLVSHSPDTMWLAIAGWLLVNLLLFIGPLLVFVGPLYRVRQEALLEYGKLAHQHHLAFKHKWIGRRNGVELLGSPDPSSVSDLNAAVEAAQTLRLVPVDRGAVIQLLTAAGLPMLAVIATQMPLVEFGRLIFGAIF